MLNKIEGSNTFINNFILLIMKISLQLKHKPLSIVNKFGKQKYTLETWM